MDKGKSGNNFNTRELKHEDISILKEKIVKKIQQEKSLELLPYFGLLSLQDAMWYGNVFELTYDLKPEGGFPASDNLNTGTTPDLPGLNTAIAPITGDLNTIITPDTRDLNSATAPDTGDVKTAMAPRSPLYLIDINHKLVGEMKVDGFNLPRSVTIFDLEAGKDGRRSSELSLCLLRCSERFLCESNASGKHDTRIINVRKLTNNDEWTSIDLQDASRSHIEARAFFAALQDTSSTLFQSVPDHVDGYEVRPMTIKETLYAVDNWKFNSKAAQVRFSASSSLGLAIGAFPFGSETPVSWAFMSWEGAIAGLQTLPEHRRKGLGKVVVKRISMLLLEKCLIPYVFIEDIESAVVPVSFFTSLGFRIFNNCHFNWIRVEI